MRTKTANPIPGVAEALAYGVLIGIALILMAYPANAHPGNEQSAKMASQQWQLVDQITQTTMLAALGYNSERIVRSIEEARDIFSQRLQGMSSGNTELSLIATRTPEAPSPIARLEAIWTRYDATLQIIITELRTAPQVKDSHIRELAEIHSLVIEAIDDDVGALEQ